MASSHESVSIFSRSFHARRLFQELIAYLERHPQATADGQIPSNARAGEPGGAIVQALSLQVTDGLERFALWAGNVGALLESSRLSLDQRLSDAPETIERVCDVLDDLAEDISDLTELVRDGDIPGTPDLDTSTEEETNGDQIKSSSEQGDAHSEQGDEDNALHDGFEGYDEDFDEVKSLLEAISESLRSLFRIATVIRNSSPRDRFKHALQASDTEFTAILDISHLREKHPKLDPDLRQRLGGANAKRRQFIKYCRDHQTRLSVEKKEEIAAQATESRPARTLLISSKATTFAPPAATDPWQNERPEGNLQDEDILSQISASTVSSANMTLKLPRLAALSPDGELFECPICRTFQSFRTEAAWRRHAFRDLKAYSCTAGCDEMFGDCNAWFEHELQHHRIRYTCLQCGITDCLSQAQLKEHIDTTHGPFSEAQSQALLNSGREPITCFKARDCPFCDEWASSLRAKLKGKHPEGEEEPEVTVTAGRFRRHVGAHHEQLAIFAVPREVDDEGAGAPGSGSFESASKRYSPVGTISNDSYPRGSEGRPAVIGLSPSEDPAAEDDPLGSRAATPSAELLFSDTGDLFFTMSTSALSRASSPALSMVGSPMESSVESASQQKVKDTREQRAPITHLLAVREMTYDELWEKWGGSEDSKKIFRGILDKVADVDKSTGKYTMKKIFYRELDIWNYEYDSESDRQLAIDNTARWYDRLRIGLTEPVWQKLLPFDERGKGKSLSKLQATLAKGPKTMTSTPKISVQKADDATAHMGGGEIESPRDHALYKFVDSHLGHRCRLGGCEYASPSVANLIHHEREAHGMHGHVDKPFMCPYEGCDRARPGNGFPRLWNLEDHMWRVHSDVARGTTPAADPLDMGRLSRHPSQGPGYDHLSRLLNDLKKHPSSWPFLAPVNKDDVADYYDIISEPMDLSTMETKLEMGQYPTPDDFIRDAKLIFNNCRKYNNESTPYAKSANKLEKFMWQQIDAIPEWSYLRPRTDVTEEPTQLRPEEYFIPRDGIEREVITADICSYLGDDALVRPGHFETPSGTIQGYYISAGRNLTPLMIESLKEDSANFLKEKDRKSGGANYAYRHKAQRESRSTVYGIERDPDSPPTESARLDAHKLLLAHGMEISDMGERDFHDFARLPPKLQEEAIIFVATGRATWDWIFGEKHSTNQPAENMDPEDRLRSLSRQPGRFNTDWRQQVEQQLENLSMGEPRPTSPSQPQPDPDILEEPREPSRSTKTPAMPSRWTVVTIWFCHCSHDGQYWLVDATPACLNCNHYRCRDCRVATTQVREQYKGFIKELYLEQSKPLKEVMRIMRAEHNFVASTKKYKYRLKAWGIRKNSRSNAKQGSGDRELSIPSRQPSTTSNTLSPSAVKAPMLEAEPQGSAAPDAIAALGSDMELEDGKAAERDDDVVDVASIVTSGYTREFLAEENKAGRSMANKSHGKEGGDEVHGGADDEPLHLADSPMWMVD